MNLRYNDSLRYIYLVCMRKTQLLIWLAVFGRIILIEFNRNDYQNTAGDIQKYIAGLLWT